MRCQLRNLPVVLLSATALTLTACGGDDPDEPKAAVDGPAMLADPASAEPVPDDAAADGGEAPATDGPDEAPADAEWVSMTDGPSGITFAMPERIEPQANTATIADGTAVSLRNYSAMSGGSIELGFNVIDTPGEGYDFDAGVEGVATSLGGEVVSVDEVKVDGNAAVDVEMTYGEDYIVYFLLVTGKEHIVQSLASGPEGEQATVRETYERLSASVAGY